MGKRRRRTGEQKTGTCVYCGKTGPITDDHVIPQALFMVLDEQMVTMPACAECQHIKELGDRDLWTFCTLEMGGSQHPDSFLHLVRIFTRNEQTARWLKRSFDESQQVPLVTEAGLIVGTGLTFAFNPKRMINTVGMMVRGLFAKKTGRILSPDTPIHAMYIPYGQTPAVLRQFGAIRQEEPTRKGDHVAFWSPYFPIDADPSTSGWILCFNDWVTFFGTSGTLAEEQVRMSAETDAKQAMREAARSLLILPERPRPMKLPSDAAGRPVVPASSLQMPSAYGPLILPVKEPNLNMLYVPIEPSISPSLVKLINDHNPFMDAIDRQLAWQDAYPSFQLPAYEDSFASTKVFANFQKMKKRPG